MVTYSILINNKRGLMIKLLLTKLQGVTLGKEKLNYVMEESTIW